MAPTDVISDLCLASLLYVSDIKRKMLYQVKLTNPAMVSDVKCKVTAPTALTFISNRLVVADKCERHIKVVDLRIKSAIHKTKYSIKTYFRKA